MTPTARTMPRTPDLEAIALEFLGSEFTRHIYSNWPIERRLDAYLRRHGPAAIADDGSAHAALLQRVMANIGRAVQDGALADTARLEGGEETP